METNPQKLYEIAKQIKPEVAFQLALEADTLEECQFCTFVLYMNMGGFTNELLHQ